MKRQTKGIVWAACGVLTVAVVGAALLWRPAPKEGEKPPFADRLAQDIISLNVENDAGGYLVENMGEGYFGVPELDGLPQDRETLSTVLRAATTRETAQPLTGTPPAGERAMVEIQYSGESLTLEVVGDCFTLAGEDRWYRAQTGGLSPFLLGEKALLSRKLGEDAHPMEVYKITLSGRNYPEQVVLESIPTNSITGPEQQAGRGMHRMTAPRQGQADSRILSPLIQSAMELTAAEVVAVRPTPQALADGGLSQPESILTVEYGKGETLVYRATRGEEGRLLLIKEGLPVLYRVEAEDCPWFAVPVGELLSLRLLAPNLEELAQVEVAGGGASYRFALSGPVERPKVRCNEQPVEGEGFLNFCRTLTQLAAQADTGETPETPPLATVTFTYREENKPDSRLEFCPGPAGMVQVRTNGAGGMLLPQEELNRLLDAAALAAQPSGDKIVD